MGDIYLGPGAIAQWTAHAYAVAYTKFSPICELCCDDSARQMRLESAKPLTNQGICEILGDDVEKDPNHERIPQD